LKLFQKILGSILIIAFLNVIVGKSIHEFFEHDHEINHCHEKSSSHFHDFEFQHLDFICNFDFATSLVPSITTFFKGFIHYQNVQLKIRFLWVVKSLTYSNNPLRGPPQI